MVLDIILSDETNDRRIGHSYMSAPCYWFKNVVGINNFIETNKKYIIKEDKLVELLDRCDIVLDTISRNRTSPFEDEVHLLDEEIARQCLPLDPDLDMHGGYNSLYIKDLADTRTIIETLLREGSHLYGFTLLEIGSVPNHEAFPK